VRETCTHRGTQCVALLAEWAHDAPSSPRRERILRWITGNPIPSHVVPLSLLLPLVAFHAAPDAASGPIALAAARRGAERLAREARAYGSDAR
jgi:hypothetical protein